MTANVFRRPAVWSLVTSLAGTLCFTTTALIRSGISACPRFILQGVSLGTAILLVSSGQEMREVLRIPLALAFLAFALALQRLWPESGRIVPGLIGMASFADVTFSTLKRYRKIRCIFSRDSVARDILEHTRLVYMLALMSLLQVEALMDRGFGVWLLAPPSVTLYLVSLILACHGRSLLLSSRNLKVVRAVVNGSMNDPQYDVNVNDRGMSVLFRKCETYMKKEEPYLDPDFRLVDMARELGTNRVYLSRTINSFSGMNFCTYTNRYRIGVARRLIKENPDIRVEEVCLKSGFRSTNTFSEVFRKEEGMSPREYIQEARDRHHRL